MTIALAIPANLQGAEQLAAALAQLQALGQRPRMLFDALGAYGEQSTRLRFKNQRGPDGRAWTPSRRAKKIGGQTLVDKARLLRSITYRARADSVEWGSNVVYAGIHQFGGVIRRAAFSSWLRLRTGRGGELLRQKKDARLAVFAKATHKRAVERRYTVEAHKIKMPARPYLGVNAADGVEILRLAAEVVTLAAQSGGPTGGKAA